MSQYSSELELPHEATETSQSVSAGKDRERDLEPPLTSTSQTQPDDEDARPPLLRLPGELRNRIWMLCLVRDEAISVGSQWEGYHGSLATEPQSAAGPVGKDDAMRVLRTNRQIHDEAASIFYGMNTFALLKYTATPFLSSPKSTYLRHIRSLALSEAAANIVLKYIMRYWPPKLKRVEISVTPRSVKARGLDQCAMDVAKKVVRIVKSESYPESPNAESIFECFELCQEPCIFIPNLNGTSVYTDEELDAAFQEKLRDILAGDCDLELSTWWPDVAASMIA